MHGPRPPTAACGCPRRPIHRRRVCGRAPRTHLAGPAGRSFASCPKTLRACSIRPAPPLLFPCDCELLLGGVLHGRDRGGADDARARARLDPPTVSCGVLHCAHGRPRGFLLAVNASASASSKIDHVLDRSLLALTTEPEPGVSSHNRRRARTATYTVRTRRSARPNNHRKRKRNKDLGTRRSRRARRLDLTTRSGLGVSSHTQRKTLKREAPPPRHPTHVARTGRSARPNDRWRKRNRNLVDLVTGERDQRPGSTSFSTPTSTRRRSGSRTTGTAAAR